MSASELVLYVDDELANRIVFEQSMGTRFRVQVAASGAEALEILKVETVAVLITDQRMPGMSGHELLVRVKALYPDTVRVVITAYSDIDPILSAVNEGLVARYVIKPWDRVEVEGLIKWSLEAFEMGRASSALQLRLMQTERLVTLGSIAAAVIHDLNQPLGSLQLNSDHLAQLAVSVHQLSRWTTSVHFDLSEPDRANLNDLASELPEIASDLQASCQVMRDLTDSLRQFMQPERGRTPTLTDPLPVIKHALSVCQDTAVIARGRLTYEGPTALPQIRIGSTQLSQILINLVSNAAQALLPRQQPGGMVVVRALEEPTALRFVVTDNGVGMSAAVLEKVGTPFFSTRAEGTGLGVAQCRRLIGITGGEFDIHSEEGKGTTVEFTIPKG